MHIYLVRHGQDLNPRPGYLSANDVPLSELGKQQAATCATKLKKALGKEDKPLIITSPRLRTMQTAQIIAELLGAKPLVVHKDNRLEERDCTQYIGKRAEEVFLLSEEDLIKGGMESYKSLYARSKSLYDELLQTGGGSPIILVTHSGNVRPLVQVAKQDFPDPTSTVEDLATDSFIRLKNFKLV